MASEFTLYNPQGFAVLDPRFVPDSLAVNDGGVDNSSYTERGPRPGVFFAENPG